MCAQKYPCGRVCTAIMTACLFFAATLALAEKAAGPHPSIPACFVLSRAEAETAVEKGISAAREGKRATVLVEDVRKEPLWVEGKRGPARDCSVWFTSLAGANLRLKAHYRWMQDQNCELADLLPDDGIAVETIDFDILLKSTARGANSSGQIHSHGDPSDVMVERFVISDDRGNVLTLLPGREPNLYPEEIKEVIALAGRPHSHSRAKPSQEVLFTAASLDFEPNAPRPHVQARYVIHTSILDPQGKPRISRDARKIRLSIFTRTGRMDVSYSLQGS
jgi:hypothetical protein